MPLRRIEIQFPFKGLNEANAFARQRGGQDGTYTTAKCQNMVGFDPRTGRNRGGSRSGVRKYCADRVNGAAAGQCLAYSVGSVTDNLRVTAGGTLRVTATGTARLLGSSTLSTYGNRVTTVVGVAGGTAALISPSGVTAIDSGTACLSSAKPTIFAVSFFNDIYFCDGAVYKYYDTTANLMVTWEATTAGTMPSQDPSSADVGGATNATPIIVTVTGHGFSDGNVVTISDVVGNTAANGTWTIQSVTTDTFELVGSVGNGAYVSGGSCTRLSGSRCALIAVWGGRIVLSGLETDPNNIFMSAVGDPFDWDYSPAVQTVQQAVAGNITSGYGKNPDIVTALIPYTDDVMLIGGTRSIRKLLGNPAEGGLSLSVTDITGIAYGSAWCQSPEGVIYFFGSRGGVYKMEPESGSPSRITALTIDERLADVDLDETTVRLEWDDRAVAVRVYITPNDGSPTTHYVWDVRNEAWWPFSYANALQNPLSVCLLSGDRADERLLLEYGQDGYVRVLDPDTASDDGSPIESHIYLGPFSNVMLTELAAVLADSSAPVSWAVCSASSLERALDMKPRSMGVLKSGRNGSKWAKAYIEHGYLRLSATGAWAMEQLLAGMDQANDNMQRVMRSNP